MRGLLGMFVALLAVDLAGLGVWVGVRFKCNPAAYTPVEVTPFIVLAGVLAALITLAVNQLREASDEYLESAADLLQKAYEILDSVKDADGRPKNSRINWLTAARLVRTGESIAAQIIMPSHARIWREKKEYWRGRIRDLIYPSSEGFPKEYYAEKADHMLVYGKGDQEPLSEKSLSVLYRFIRWPEGIEDPLNNEKPFTKEEVEKMVLFGPKGLGQLLSEVQEIKAKKK